MARRTAPYSILYYGIEDIWPNQAIGRNSRMAHHPTSDQDFQIQDESFRLRRVDKKLAGATAGGRQLRGCFSQSEEWSDIGNARNKHPTQKRPASVHTIGEESLLVGSKPTIFAHDDLQPELISKSMMNFVCKGQSIASASRPNSPPAPASASVRVGRPTMMTNRMPKRPQPQVQQTSVFSSKQDPSGQCPEARRQLTARTDVQKVTGCLPSSSSQLLVRRDSSELPVADLQRCSAEGCRPHVDVESGSATGTLAQPSGEPTAILKASSTGNDINVSCTIEKRKLRPFTAMAFHCDRAFGTSTEASQNGQILATGTNRLDVQDDKVLGNEYNIKMCELLTTRAGMMKPLSFGEDTCHSPAFREETPAQATLSCRKAIPTNLTHSSRSRESNNSGSQLSKGNLLIHEKTNTLSKEDRKHYVAAWIRDVNDARNIKRVISQRERLTEGGRKLDSVPVTRKAAKLRAPPGVRAKAVSPGKTPPQPPNSLNGIVCPSMVHSMPRAPHQMPKSAALPKSKSTPMRREGKQARIFISKEKSRLGAAHTRKWRGSTMSSANDAVVAIPTSGDLRPKCGLQIYSYRHSVSLADCMPKVGVASISKQEVPPLDRYAPKHAEGLQRRQDGVETVKKEEWVHVKDSIERTSDEKRPLTGLDTYSEGKSRLLKTQSCLRQLKKQPETTSTRLSLVSTKRSVWLPDPSKQRLGPAKTSAVHTRSTESSMTGKADKLMLKNKETRPKVHIMPRNRSESPKKVNCSRQYKSDEAKKYAEPENLMKWKPESETADACNVM